MTGAEIVEKVKAALGERVLQGEVALGDAVAHVAPAELPHVARFLKSDPDLAFDYLADICGVDYLPREPRFEVVYTLHSIAKNHSIRLRVALPGEKPSVSTVSDLWKSAVFPELELYDMFGINVEGHPGLKRLLMPEDWEGHPLRKDYPLMREDVAFSYNRDYKSDLVQAKPPTR